MATLDEVADALYAAAPADFIPNRDAASRQARVDGDRDLAREIARLRKPTVSAWLVNLLMRDDDALGDQLVALGDQLREAERSLDGPELRQLSRARRDLVRGLVIRARALARDQGHRTSETVAQEVDTTLTAALADPHVAAEVTSGRLTGPREYSGFGGATSRAHLSVVRDSAAPSSPGAAGRGGTDRSRRRQQDPDPAERDADRAEREADRAEREAEREAERAEREAEERRRREEAKERRREAERRLLEAEEEWQVARRALDDARSDERAATDRRDRLTRELADAEHDVTAAGDRSARADRSLQAARDKVNDLRRRLDRLT